MNTKHTSKTLQERLERLNSLKATNKALEAFHGAHRVPGDIEIAVSHKHYLWLSEEILVNATSSQWLLNFKEIEQILEELGLEE